MNTPRVVAIIQARMASTRLPGKVLADIAGQPMLRRVFERAKRATTVEQVVVATTTAPEDDEIADLCRRSGEAYFRGHPVDVLDRFLQASRAYRAGVIVRLTADCPLLDPSVVDQTVRALLDSDPPADFAANRLPEDRTFPIGLDTEVCRQSVLETVAQEADQPYHREHVMPYIYEVPGRFRVVPVRAERDWGHLRWTVDTPEDLAFARAVYAHFAPRVDFGWLEVLALIEAQPELQKINADVRHKSYRESG